MAPVRRLPTFSQLVRTRRKQLDWSLRDLSERSGVSITYIHQIEHNVRHVPSQAMLQRLCATLRLDYDTCCFLTGQWPEDLRDGAPVYEQATLDRVRRAFTRFRQTLMETETG